MADFLNTIIPNVMTKPDELWESFGQTVYMVIVSGAISMVFGLFFGIILTATSPKGVLKNKVIFNILDKLVNIFRSIPFVILLTALIPLTRMVVGTAIGTKGCDLTADLWYSAVLYRDRSRARWLKWTTVSLRRRRAWETARGRSFSVYT